MDFWKEKVVLITGGSSGLGRMIAESFVEVGAKIVLVALEKADVEKAANEIFESFTQKDKGERPEAGGRRIFVNVSKPSDQQSTSTHGAEAPHSSLQPPVSSLSSVFPIHADITLQEDVDRVFQEVEKRFGRLDVLVNNAGRSMRGKVLDTTPEQFQSLFDLNVLGTVRCTRAAAPMLLKNRGSVVNIGSLAAKSASRWVGAYPVSKHAVAAYSQQLRLELGSEGLHVLLVCPGPIKRDNPRLYPLEGIEGIPESALAPGAGVKIGKIDPVWLGRRIVKACEKRELELVVPWKAKLLFAISQLFPAFGDWLVLKNT